MRSNFMKKLIILFALLTCLLPIGVYGAGICEVKCCDNSTGCEDLDSFCNNLAPNNQTGISELSSCSVDQITAAKCGTSDTAVCCCFKDRNITTTKVSTEVTSLNFTPEISIPGSVFNNTAPIKVGTPIETNNGNVKTVTMNSDLLAKYIQAIYNYGLAIVSILAAIVLMGGGLIWLTSGGDSSKVTKAKEMIIGSISGLAILFCAWIILNTVNPELLKLKPISTVVINKVSLGCCEKAKGDGKLKMTTSNDCEQGFDQSKGVSGNKCEDVVCCTSYIVGALGQGKKPICYDTFSSSCEKQMSGIGSDTKMTKMACSRVNECAGAGSMIKCDGITDGDNPENGPLLRCYGGVAYYNTGAKLSEPCGVKKNGGAGICVNSGATCNDKNQIGGRSCEKPLDCCID